MHYQKADSMTNLERIRKLPPKELARLLVRAEEVNIGDEDCQGNWMDSFETYYVPPDNSGWYIEEEDAVEYTIEWLQRRYEGKE